MTFSVLTYLTAILAGLLSSLSPCVLPLLPIVAGSASQAHRWGPLALAVGLALSFALLGTPLALLVDWAGLGTDVVRQAAAWLLLLAGIVLLSACLQRKAASLGAVFGYIGNRAMGRIGGGGVAGQLLTGLALGLVWTPCVGLLLGTATALAALGKQLPQTMLLMLVFGVGAGVPLVLIGRGTQRMFTAYRDRLIRWGVAGRRLMGGLLIVMGVAALTGFDHRLEAWAMHAWPDWLTSFSTRF